MTQLKNQLPENVYRIGAVARLTGIAADTLRIWERRYNLVNPQRTEKGGRLYNQEDVTRLTMIKTLVDQGHAISTVASLDGPALRERLSRSRSNNLPLPGTGQQEVCVIGQALMVRAHNTEGMPEGLELAGSYTSLEAFLEDETNCDTLVIEFPFLDRYTLRSLQNETLTSRIGKLIVIYAFAPSPVLRQFKRTNIITQRAPIGIEHIWQMCASESRTHLEWEPDKFIPEKIAEDPVPNRMYSNRQLAALSQVTSTLKCECPHHLSSIIELMVAFEKYSAECETSSTEDAALHAYLHGMTAKARWLMEVALQKLAEVEQIDPNKLPLIPD